MLLKTVFHPGVVSTKSSRSAAADLKNSSSIWNSILSNNNVYKFLKLSLSGILCFVFKSLANSTKNKTGIFLGLIFTLKILQL